MEENPLENETEPVNLHHWNLQSYPHKWIHYYGMILLPPNQLTSNSLPKLSISSDKLPRTKIQNTFLTNKETFRFLCFFILANKTLSPPIPKKKVLYQTTIASNFWWENPKTKETKLTRACLMASVGGDGRVLKYRASFPINFSVAGDFVGRANQWRSSAATTISLRMHWEIGYGAQERRHRRRM